MKVEDLYKRQDVHESYLPTLPIVSESEGEELLNGRWRDRMLKRAANCGDVVTLRRLASAQHPRVNREFLSQLYHTAAANGHCEIVRALIELGACCQRADAEGRNPAHVAAANGHIAIVEILVEKAAVDLETRDGHGRTVFQAAQNSDCAAAIIQLQKAAPEIHLRRWFNHENQRILMASRRHSILLGPMAPVAFADEYVYDPPSFSEEKETQLLLEKRLLQHASSYYGVPVSDRCASPVSVE